MNKEMKILLGVMILSWVILLAGIGLFISPLDQQTTYHATGEVVVTPAQWETLKETFAATEVPLTQVQTLDSAGNLLVEFTGIPVKSDFPYGTLTVNKGKADNSPAQTGEVVCVILGGILVPILTATFSTQWR